MMQLCGTARLFKMSSVMCATLVVTSLASLALAAPLDVKVKAKGTEEVLMFGNHQNAPRVKKSDVASAAAAAAEDAVEEAAEVKDTDSSARAPAAAAAGEGQGDEVKSTDQASSSSAAVETDSVELQQQQQQEEAEDEDATDSAQQEDAYDPDGYFPYFSPYRRKRASAKALTAEDMTLTSSADDVRREKRSAHGHQALTAEDMTLTSSSSSRARRDAPLALTAEDMTSPLTSAKRLQRFKRNIYDGYVDDVIDADEDDEDEEEEEEDDAFGAYKRRDLDIDDDLSEEEQALLLRYLESNPDLLDALSQYGADERQRAEQWERARQAEAEEEDIREALQYLDQLEDGQVAAQSAPDSDDDDPEIEYEPIVYHGEPGIFIPVPAEVVGEVEKRSRWQEVAEEEAEREQYEEAYGRLLDLARALRRRGYEQEEEEEEKK